MPSEAPPGHERPHPIYNGEVVSLRELVRALWHYRWLIVLLSILGGLAGIGASLYSTRYLSEGLFLTPGMKLGDFKRYETALDNEPRLEEFIQSAKITDDKAASQLRRLVRTDGAFANAVQPTFMLTGRDAKSYDIPATEGSDALVGIRLAMEHGEAEGQAPVLVLAEYLRSTIIKVALKDAILDQCLQFQLRELELRNEQIQGEFSIRQLQDKAVTLRKLIAANPGSASTENRQVVSLENGGERFLSPTAQLVAAEVGIADLQLADDKRSRDRLAASLKQEYYCRVRAEQEHPVTGQALLARLGAIRTDVFEGQDMASDIVEQTANELDIQRKAFTDLYLERMRFVVSPDGAERRVRDPSMRIGLLLGAVVGGLLGVLLALLLAWWHDNRDAVIAKDW